MIITVGDGKLGLNNQTSQGTTEIYEVPGFHSLLHGGLEGPRCEDGIEYVSVLETVVDNGILYAGSSESTLLITFEDPSRIESGSISLGIVMVELEECTHGIATDAEIFTSEASGKEIEEIWVFRGDIPTMQGRGSEEGDGMSDGESGDPRTTYAIENDIEHVLEADELDELGVGWLFDIDQNSLNGVRYGYGGQFEQLGIRSVLAHETNQDWGVFRDLGANLIASMVSDSRQCDQGDVTRALLFKEWE